MPEIKLTAVDATAGPLRTAANNFKTFAKQLENIFTPAGKGATNFAKTVSGAAQTSKQHLDALLRSSAQLSPSLDKFGLAAERSGTKAHGAFSKLTTGMSGTNAELAAMAGRFIGVGAAVETARRSFLSFT